MILGIAIYLLFGIVYSAFIHTWVANVVFRWLFEEDQDYYKFDPEDVGHNAFIAVFYGFLIMYLSIIVAICIARYFIRSIGYLVKFVYNGVSK